MSELTDKIGNVIINTGLMLLDASQPTAINPVILRENSLRDRIFKTDKGKYGMAFTSLIGLLDSNPRKFLKEFVRLSKREMIAFMKESHESLSKEQFINLLEVVTK